MSRGMGRNAGRYVPARVKDEIMQFSSWSEWLKFAKWQKHCGCPLTYVSHKRADDGKVFVKFFAA